MGIAGLAEFDSRGDDTELVESWIGDSRWNDLNGSPPLWQAQAYCLPETVHHGHMKSVAVHSLVAEAAMRILLMKAGDGDTFYISRLEMKFTRPIVDGEKIRLRANDDGEGRDEAVLRGEILAGEEGRVAVRFAVHMLRRSGP